MVEIYSAKIRCCKLSIRESGSCFQDSKKFSSFNENKRISRLCTFVRRPPPCNQNYRRKIIKPPVHSKPMFHIELSDDPFVLPDDFEEIPQFITYRCQKIVSSRMFGKQTVFQLINKEGKIIYSAKFKPGASNPSISIYQGDFNSFSNNPSSGNQNNSNNSSKSDNSHENGTVGVILSSNKLTNFSLRKQTRYGNEIMSIKFSKGDDPKMPRTIQIYANIEDSQKPLHLHSMLPKKTIFGTWQLDLNADHVFTSAKNSRIINDSNETVFITRKVERRVLEIEALANFELLQLFAICVASYICKLK
ncbi:hypothetical protein TRFO_20392 [Tritrichomonas foetus]|uniref:Tubby C-terminal domain-containing protein n=1 Tax=Tritrichomonas foetus TaxID=1144522 RepID=A0A1J4KG07_9EUKA|nr:hypothetical protein TRFO_20392 [Tritrichomonas foetus]|eukprot:OHT10351.1 hypothetical protein TRFO_20392 [Tritrichomonas foetus]